MESTAAKTNDDKSTELTDDQKQMLKNAFFGKEEGEGLKEGDVDAKIKAINKAFQLVKQIRHDSPGSEAALAEVVTKCVNYYAAIVRQSTLDIVQTVIATYTVLFVEAAKGNFDKTSTFHECQIIIREAAKGNFDFNKIAKHIPRMSNSIIEQIDKQPEAKMIFGGYLPFLGTMPLYWMTRYIESAIWIPRFIETNFARFPQLLKSSKIANELSYDLFFLISQASVSALLYAESKAQEAIWLVQYPKSFFERDPNSPLDNEATKKSYVGKIQSLAKESEKAYYRVAESMYYLTRFYRGHEKTLESMAPNFWDSIVPNLLGFGPYPGNSGFRFIFHDYSPRYETRARPVIRDVYGLETTNDVMEELLNLAPRRFNWEKLLKREGFVLQLEAYISSLIAN